MKKFGLLVVATSISLLSFAAKKTIVIKTQIACDHCLQCNSCGQNINDKIKTSEKGVRSVKIDSKANTITVNYLDNKTSPEQIKKAIDAAGFEADELKPTAEAYDKLDGCCKKK